MGAVFDETTNRSNFRPTAVLYDYDGTLNGIRTKYFDEFESNLVIPNRRPRLS